MILLLLLSPWISQGEVKNVSKLVEIHNTFSDLSLDLVHWEFTCSHTPLSLSIHGTKPNVKALCPKWSHNKAIGAGTGEESEPQIQPTTHTNTTNRTNYPYPTVRVFFFKAMKNREGLYYTVLVTHFTILGV